MKKIILCLMLMLILPLCVVKADRVDKVIYSTSFETEEERNFWDLTGDLDSDGDMWEFLKQECEVNDSGGLSCWNVPHNGDYSIKSASNALTPNNLAISNPITIDEVGGINSYIRISWYATTQLSEEQYSVYIFKGDETTENIKTAIKNNTVEAIYNETLLDGKTPYQYRSVDIKEKLTELYGDTDEEKTIRIVFRHHDTTDQHRLTIDSISIERYYKPHEIKKYTFEDGLEGWTNIDYDGDGYVWEYKTSSDSDDESNFAGYNSEAAIASASYYNEEIGTLYPENYIISPKIKIDSRYNLAELNWYVGASHSDWDHEQYSVYVYSGTEELAKDNIKTKLADDNISQLLHEETLSTHEFSLNTALLDEKFIGKEVQVVFVHHNSYDQDWLKVDDVAMYGYITDGISSGGTEGGDLSGGTNPPTDEVILGDWNGNGSYTLMDLIQYRSYLVNPTEISDEVLARVDLNEDGKINLVDLIAARKLLVGLSIN